MTLLDIETDVLSRLGYNISSVDATVKARIDRFINETQQEILSEPGMEELLFDTVTFASVASTPTYSLPPILARIRTMRETTNRRIILPMSIADYRLAYPDPTTTTGTPTNYVELGYAFVSQQPADASELFVKSSDNVTDTGGSKKAYIEGYTTGGQYRAASVAVNGTTGASFSSSITTWIEVTRFYLDFTPVGVISLFEDSLTVGTLMAQIGIGLTNARHRKIALAPCPSAAITYTMDFERDVPSMSNANDESILPVRFHRLLSLGARMREYEKQDQRRYKDAQAEYLYALKKFKHFMLLDAAGRPNLRGALAERPSQLGGWFPANT